MPSTRTSSSIDNCFDHADEMSSTKVIKLSDLFERRLAAGCGVIAPPVKHTCNDPTIKDKNNSEYGSHHSSFKWNLFYFHFPPTASSLERVSFSGGNA